METGSLSSFIIHIIEIRLKCANKNGFSVIRILQDNVWKNKYNWLSELISNIEKITTQNRVQNIYISKNNEYNDFEKV